LGLDLDLDLGLCTLKVCQLAERFPPLAVTGPGGAIRSSPDPTVIWVTRIERLTPSHAILRSNVAPLDPRWWDLSVQKNATGPPTVRLV
jgi:hypothetical protein